MRLLLFCERNCRGDRGERREGKGREGHGMGLMTGWLGDGLRGIGKK